MPPCNLAVVPPLDPDFVPASIWNRGYRALAEKDPGSRVVRLALQRPEGAVTVWEGRLLDEGHPQAELTPGYLERLVKFLLWAKGGYGVLVAGADNEAQMLANLYSRKGSRAFDGEFLGERVFRRPFFVRSSTETFPKDAAGVSGLGLGRQLGGCRIGFDLGGSDRKVAALIDGRVVFSEEIPWDPYFQKDPKYHYDGVNDSLKRAAAHLPRVDAIGGSAAGIYVDNEIGVASLFRGVSRERFDAEVRRMFYRLRDQWGGVPFEVVNDGDVTALAGSMSLGENAVLGISMGTSQAAGYVTPTGALTPWLNELAFVPVDYRENAPIDEWSGDAGCGVQYFSQQCIGRLAACAGFESTVPMPLPELLVRVQKAMADGDDRALRIYETVGTYFGYSLAHYAEFYDFRHVIVLGRVMSGPGGEIILSRARKVLEAEFPALYETVRLHLPDENDRRHGQAVAAASLPALKER